jgi:uncharacterized membrane protein YfcA
MLLYLGIMLIGLGGGIASGLFGIGGGIVMIPAMVLLAKLDQHTANGTSLMALLLPVGILGVREYYRRGQLNLVYGALLAAGLVAGVLIGAKLAGRLDDLVLRRAFAVFLIVVAVRMLLTKR